MRTLAWKEFWQVGPLANRKTRCANGLLRAPDSWKRFLDLAYWDVELSEDVR
jgi:hypothetical protein